MRLTQWMLPVLLLTLTACAAHVDDVQPQTAAIAGGVAAGACDYPSVVELRSATSLCSGVLVAPRVVLYAGHCGADIVRITFGSAGSSTDRQTPTRCFVHPRFAAREGYDWLDYDFAVCELPVAVDLPVVPIVMGCEVDQVVPGAAAVLVGFGRTPSGGSGVKHSANGEVVGMLLAARRSVIVFGATPAEGICPGDSGGPDFLRLDDGTWRVFGIHSMQGGSGCDGGDHTDALASMAVPFIESVLPYDVSPCHDADGVWSPGLGCGRFPVSLEGSGASWGSCASTPLASTPSATCVPTTTDGGVGDGGTIDGGVSDGGTVDGGTVDGSVSDGSTDDGGVDGAIVDGGADDARVSDAGAPDATPPDSPDSTVPDAGTPDGDSDSGGRVDAGSTGPDGAGGCAIGGHRGEGPGAWLALLCAVWCRRRRRQRQV
ncbi:MAG: trypsin-like serine protease [Deltaproteobacteria bacterium]|nr:trypsin-like serine protease [Deltaproteobacteria bacterium]